MLKRAILFVILTLALVLSIAISYIRFFLPDVGEAENIKIEYTPERIAHGKYLANHVAVCMDCHSKRDWTMYSGPMTKGTLGQGGELFSQEFGFPGKYYSRNITPYGIGDWTDGELLRGITTGVTKSGKALFPVMPHPAYGTLDKEDIYDIIAYVRSLPAIKNEVQASESDFPMSIIINTIPKPATFSKRPNPADVVAYGKYVFTMAACKECHTKQEKGKAIEGMELAGGFEFPMANGRIVRSANITPDEETGIGAFTEEMFVNRFTYYNDSTYTDNVVKPGEPNTVMPWRMYAGMSEQDLKAVYAYLKTIKPINNQVVRFQ